MMNNSILNKSTLNKGKIKEGLIAFFGEIFFHALFYFLLFTAVGLYMLIGFWVILAIFPMGVCFYYLFKKYKFI